MGDGQPTVSKHWRR